MIFGVTQVSIKNWLDLLETDPAVQRAVERGDIPSYIATELAPLPREDQKTTLATMLENGVPKGRAGVKAARAAKEGKDAPAQSKKVSVAFLRLLSETLAPTEDEPELADDEAVAYLFLQWIFGEKPLPKEAFPNVSKHIKRLQAS